MVLLAGCQMGPSVSGSFERSLDVSGPIRVELNNVAGDVSIVGSVDGKVHVHGDVRVSGFGFGNPQSRLDSIVSNPPVELKGDTLRSQRSWSRTGILCFRNRSRQGHRPRGPALLNERKH